MTNSNVSWKQAHTSRDAILTTLEQCAFRAKFSRISHALIPPRRLTKLLFSPLPSLHVGPLIETPSGAGYSPHAHPTAGSKNVPITDTHKNSLLGIKMQKLTQEVNIHPSNYMLLCVCEMCRITHFVKEANFALQRSKLKAEEPHSYIELQR